MGVTVHNIKKTEARILYADAKPITYETGVRYEISFTSIVSNHTINSTITIEHNEDLSFSKAEQIIKDILIGGNKSQEDKVIWECIECGHQHEFNKGDFRQDGLRCKCCKGMVVNKPNKDRNKVSEAAFYIREKILERDIHYCRSLTPKQVDTIIELYNENK